MNPGKMAHRSKAASSFNPLANIEDRKRPAADGDKLLHCGTCENDPCHIDTNFAFSMSLDGFSCLPPSLEGVSHGAGHRLFALAARFVGGFLLPGVVRILPPQ